MSTTLSMQTLVALSFTKPLSAALVGQCSGTSSGCTKVPQGLLNPGPGFTKSRIITYESVIEYPPHQGSSELGSAFYTFQNSEVTHLRRKHLEILFGLTREGIENRDLVCLQAKQVK
jgi:hypothetical protein